MTSAARSARWWRGPAGDTTDHAISASAATGTHDASADLQPAQTSLAASDRDQPGCLPDLLSSTGDRLLALRAAVAGPTHDEPGRPRCFACQAAQQIDAALATPDGSIRSELAGVRDALTGLERPRSLLTNWHDPASLRLLSAITAGRLELSHEALDALPQGFSVTYLRALLIAGGALPARDENFARLHRHPARVVADVADPEMRGALTRYARWHVVGHAKTDRHDHIASGVAARCRADIDTARGFIDYLTTVGQDLDDCPQALLGAWITTDRGRRLGFIRWLKRGGYLLLTRLPEPITRKDPAHEIDPAEQLALARTLLHEPGSASIEDRAAACLLLLYAQPAAKIVTLTTDDLEVRNGDTYLALGDGPVLLIAPLDALVTALPFAKPFGAARILADSRWLFAGRNAGTHLHPASLIRRMHQLGIHAGS